MSDLKKVSCIWDFRIRYIDIGSMIYQQVMFMIPGVVLVDGCPEHRKIYMGRNRARNV